MILPFYESGLGSCVPFCKPWQLTHADGGKFTCIFTFLVSQMFGPHDKDALLAQVLDAIGTGWGRAGSGLSLGSTRTQIQVHAVLLRPIPVTLVKWLTLHLGFLICKMGLMISTWLDGLII